MIDEPRRYTINIRVTYNGKDRINSDVIYFGSKEGARKKVDMLYGEYQLYVEDYEQLIITLKE